MLAIILVVFLAGCTESTQTIRELTANDDFVDKTVKVKGTATNSLKIGELSGYVLVDKNGDDMLVASERLPADGDKVIVDGFLRKKPIGLGNLFYIEVK